MSVWLYPELSNEIIKNDGILKQIPNIISDIMSGNLAFNKLIENMEGVLVNKEALNREKGMRFFTDILKLLPKDYLSEKEVTFTSKFYWDRLKDSHNVIPVVLDGYLAIIDMDNYIIANSAEFFTTLFREVSCQSQVREDRYKIYKIVDVLLRKDAKYMKSFGPDFVYGVISSMDGERDPRNLLFLFTFLPNFIRNIELGHLVDDMFNVMSCYFPIDFQPHPDTPTSITRNDLANALGPCLCASPEFAEQCLVLLIEKLDSNLRSAKLDSFKLLAQSCLTFKSTSYVPFLPALWSIINREITSKIDVELQMAAHEALHALVNSLSSLANTDQAFEGFIKSILKTMQTSIAESTTVAQATQATAIILTTANASKESCLIITKCMIPAAVVYYGINASPKLQVINLTFLGDLYDLAKQWDVTEDIQVLVSDIAQVCLSAVSQREKDFQIAGFKTLIKILDTMKSGDIKLFLDILVHNVKYSQDDDLLGVSVETIHEMAVKYPEEIMALVLKDNCSFQDLKGDKILIEKRLNLLCNLATIDDFTKIIIETMLTMLSDDEEDADKVVKAMSSSMSNASLYTRDKVVQIETDHGLVDSVVTWLQHKMSQKSPPENLTHGFSLIATTMSNLSEEKQKAILAKHTRGALENCNNDEMYFVLLESLYNSIRKSIYDSCFQEIMMLALNLSLRSDSELIRGSACVLISHFLNKADYGPSFELLYETLKTYLSSCSKDNLEICPRLILLYGWIAKGLILRGGDLFMFWLQKIMVALTNPSYCQEGAEAIRLIMTTNNDILTTKQHCRVSHLYKQRMFQIFLTMSEQVQYRDPATKVSYFKSWAYILDKVPKTILNNEIVKITPIVIESLEYDNKELSIVMVDVLSHIVQTYHVVVAGSLQTILPRLIKLTSCNVSMDVRIKSLQCLYDIANCYPTVLLLPHKQDILIDLAPSLDDKKRLVRKMAVRARTRWYLIGAPGESKDN